MDRRANRRRYYERHREELREKNHLWCEQNRAYISEKNREWRLAHPGVTQANNKRWREANPEMWAAQHRARASNRRAKEAGVPGRISAADVRAVWACQPVCVECGNGRGLDHIVEFWQGGENTPDNLQNLCVSCNVRKTARLRFAASTVGREQLADARAARVRKRQSASATA